jgi:mycoredoxin
MDGNSSDLLTDPTDEGADASRSDAVIMFWRPGCGFCSSLRRSLERDRLPVVEVNIWEDPRGAAAVRAITGGHETVPTVVVADMSMVNPSGLQVLEAVERHAPHLLGAA